MKPTAIGMQIGDTNGIGDVRQGHPLAVVGLADTGAIVLDAQQMARCQEKLGTFDFAAMPAAQVVTIGSEAERSLHKTLDGFLGRLDQGTAATVFALFDQLQKGVDDANLPEVLKKVQQVKPGLWAVTVGLFKFKKPKTVAREMFDNVKDILSGRTKTLADVMKKMEGQFDTEIKRLLAELDVLDRLKLSYGSHRDEFAVDAALAHALFCIAKAFVASEESRVAAAPDAREQARLQELQAKLQMLESRALALEGTYTRLPADQLVIQQIEQAGITTLSETLTTASSRFASIKMTLLTLQGAFAVKGVQRMNAQGAKLDAQLQQVRGQLVKQVVTDAANAAGDNRLAQANQIHLVITQSEEVKAIIAQARQDNQTKFAQARQLFQEARDALAKPS